MLGICLNMQWLKYFIDEGYWEGLNIVPVLLLGYVFLGVYYNISIWFKVTDKTYFGTIITIGGAVITILLNYWLIPIYGLLGSSIVTLTCYLLMTVACYFIGQKYFPVPYAVGKGLGVILITCLIVFANEKIVIENYFLSLSLRGLVSLLLLGVVYKITIKESVPS
jgi:O-antigen/teichoic acid export membrane protein